MKKGLSEKQIILLGLMISVGLLCGSVYSSFSDGIRNLFLALAFVTGGYFVIGRGWDSLISLKPDRCLFLTIAAVVAFWMREGRDAVLAVIIFQLLDLFGTPSEQDPAHWQLDGQLIDIEPERITEGMTLVYHKGERYYTDGINTADGSTVSAGNYNNTRGDVTVRTTADSAVVQERNVICDNSESEARLRRITGFITFGIICLAVYLLFVKGYDGAKVLSVAAFCLHVPFFFENAVRKAERDGTAVKDAASLEAIGQEKSVTFTNGFALTAHEYQIEEIIAEDEVEFLKIAASILSNVERDYSQLIVSRYGSDDLKIVKISEETEQGIKAKVSTRNYYLGSYDYLTGNELPVGERIEGNVLYLSTRKQYLGCIRLSLLPSAETVSLFRQLRNAGVENIYISEPPGLNTEMWQIGKFDPRNRYTEIAIADDRISIGEYAETGDTILNKIPSLFTIARYCLRNVRIYGIVMIIFKTALLYLIMLKGFTMWQVVLAESIADLLFRIHKIR